ncbi:MAG: phospholipase D-like domain-containing protein [Gemmatimonadales bacterium]
MISPVRLLADQAFSRAAGAPLLPGNQVRLLKDAAENYPAWLEAIRSAEHLVHFESYIIHDDDVGAEFAECLAAQARKGVRVRLLYDWMGALGKTSSRFWKRLRMAGVEVRCFNPPRFDSPFGWLSRDHRKTIVVDGRVGFVTGLCVGRMWAGQPERGIEPWRDTGVEVRGPAVADISDAFAEVWALAGAPIPEADLVRRDAPGQAGDVSVRVVATTPGSASLFRVDQLVAALAQKALWLTDAYFVGTAAYVESLRAAARDGVDVRLLVPGPSDIPLLRPLSVAGYQPLLEAGVRVFEWNGPMLHAKTAVADGRWARVGSSNLNVASWIGNHEMDVVVKDDGFGAAMERMYQDDLGRATEIILGRSRSRSTSAGGSAGRLAAGAIRIGNTVSAAATGRRIFAPTEARVLALSGFLLLGVVVLALLWPRVVVIPLMLVIGWVAVALLLRSNKLRRLRRPSAPS